MGIETQSDVMLTTSVSTEYDRLNNSVIDTRVVLFQRQYTSGGEIGLMLKIILVI